MTLAGIIALVYLRRAIVLPGPVALFLEVAETNKVPMNVHNNQLQVGMVDSGVPLIYFSRFTFGAW